MCAAIAAGRAGIVDCSKTLRMSLYILQGTHGSLHRHVAPASCLYEEDGHTGASRQRSPTCRRPGIDT